MNKSYLLQGFKATIKTYRKKKSNILTFIFLSIASFLGKLFILPKPFFEMMDMNVAKNSALYNEINIPEAFRGTDSLKGNVLLHVLNFIKNLFVVSMIIMITVLVLILLLATVGIDALTTLSAMHLLMIAPVIIIGVILMCVVLSIFIPQTYITLYIKEKSLFNILYSSKISLKASLVFKVFFYNLFYYLVIFLIPIGLAFYFMSTSVTLLTIVVGVLAALLYIYIFGVAKLTRDSAIFLLFENNVKFGTKDERKNNTEEVTEEEKLTNIFTKA
ncbi:MAG: hypothetical protein R3Y60_00640 [bacterium]